jgi:anti-sigma regulatory factor (Ser/Thr protein kinase)
MAYDAMLLISELATNACLYSASGDLGGAFTVRIERFGGHLRVEIEDQGSAWDGDLSSAKPPHGLYLLQALSDSCGTYPGTQGWVTWYTLVTPPGAAL